MHGQADDLNVNPGRILRGLSRIGYKPQAALADIIDNAVQARAWNVRVLVQKLREDLPDTSKNNVAAYEVVDDGRGMDEAGMRNALALGSSPDDYGKHSLSKFGLGLKSAAFSQGDELHLISSPGGGVPFARRVVSIPEVEAQARYFARNEPLSEHDRALIARYLPEGRGTIVRIAAVRRENHAKVSDTLDALHRRLGVVYYYALQERDLDLRVVAHGQETRIEPFDVLATAEAEAHGDLDENTWDGLTTRWLHRTETLVLDTEADIRATVEVTQLPHPPSLGRSAPGGKNAVRDAYSITGTNYGYYVYRNGRLISWAERFGGILPLTTEQDLYSFRGRILIDESADETFNIDVKKADLMLSEEAWDVLDDLTARLKNKSKRAWNHAKAELQRQTQRQPNQASNELAKGFDPPELPEDSMPSASEAAERLRREEEIAREQEARLRAIAARWRSAQEEHPVAPEEVTAADLSAVARGDANPAAEQIFRVDQVEDGALWEPYHSATHGGSVRINREHRFARLLFENNVDNVNMQVIAELLLLQLANAEVYTQTHLAEVPQKVSAQVLTTFRRAASEFLAALCRKRGDELPPL